MTTPVSLVVIDTHAIIWYLEDSPRLSSNARHAFDSIDRGLSTGVISAIVLAELTYVSEKGRTPLGFEEVVARIQDSRNFGIVSFDLGILMRMRNLAAFELHDRTIVATAQSFGSRLITQDRTIRDSGIVECIW